MTRERKYEPGSLRAFTLIEPLVLIATSAILAAMLLPRLASAALVGPYAPDANTVLLLHLDETAGSTNIVSDGSFGKHFLALTLAPTAANTNLMGAAGYSTNLPTAISFGLCTTNPAASPNANGLACDNDNNGAFTYSTTSFVDYVTNSVFNMGNGGQTPWTVEALVQPNASPLPDGTAQIISSESANNSTATRRAFQFRISTAGGVSTLTFTAVNVTGTTSLPSSGVIPSSGPNALEAGAWYHAAATYDGTNVTLYWTRLDPTNEAANVLSVAPQSLGASWGNNSGMLVVGNSARGASNSFPGSVDEVRISTVARATNEMQFYTPGVITPGATITVDFNTLRQTIYGFGAGMKRQTGELRSLQEPWRSEVLDLMFADVDTRIVRTYLRHNHENSNDNADPNVLNTGALTFGSYNNDVWLLQQAAAIGGAKLDTFYASCNTGPAWMKSNTNIIGGTLITSNYTEFAEFLWAYLRWMKKTNGFDIAALSMFNEPDYIATHDSMNPTAAQAADLMAVAGPYLAGKYFNEPAMTRPLLLGPDGSGVNDSVTYLNAMLANPASAAVLEVVASHYYGGSVSDWNTLNTQAGSRMLWQTEWARLSGASDDINDGLVVASKMHDVLSQDGEAYVAFQWIDETTDTTRGNGLIRIQTNSYVVPKRYYVFKQFVNTTPRASRRVVTSLTTSSLKVTGYLWPDGNTFSIQVINDTPNVIHNVFFQCTQASGPVRRYRTSSTLNAAHLPVTLTATNNLFIDTIQARSFNTFVGVLNSAPVLTAPSNRTVNAGITVVAANSASDVDAPPQILTFSLLSAPVGATINSNSGVFTWRPPVAAANSTNMINVVVADNGSPGQSATQTFVVTVNPLNAPTMTLQNSTNGLVQLSVAGDFGPDYTVQATTNLANWTNLFTTNSPVLPFNWTDPAASFPYRFYRAVPGP